MVLLHCQRQNSYRAKIICQITCPGCLKLYVGKTDRCFHIKMNDHGRKSDQPMHRHLRNCIYFQELGQLYSLPCDDETVNIDIKEHLINAVLNNCRIIDQNNNWSQLSFLEAYYIKTLKPEITDGPKASKELERFILNFMISQPGYQTFTIHLLSNIS